MKDAKKVKGAQETKMRFRSSGDGENFTKQMPNPDIQKAEESRPLRTGSGGGSQQQSGNSGNGSQGSGGQQQSGNQQQTQTTGK
jgi:hypothetical protein